MTVVNTGNNSVHKWPLKTDSQQKTRQGGFFVEKKSSDG